MSLVKSIVEMPLNDIKEFVVANVKAQCNIEITARLCIFGSPGCGKSDLIREICETNGWGLSVKYLSNMDLCQITGIPCHVKEGDIAKFTKPEVFNFSKLDYVPDGYTEGITPTILFIDDFHLADKITQKYLFQILTYKTLSNYKLPKNTAIILAGNKLTDKALANTIPAPVMNRLAVFYVKSDKDDWIKNYAMTHDVRDDIVSFINTKGELCLSEIPVESAPWASPRAWTFLSDQINYFEKTKGKLEINDLQIIANSLVSPAVAAEFISYREIFSKWDMDKLKEKSIAELENLFKNEIDKNPVNAYGITNAAMIWMISKTKAMGFDVTNPELKKITSFAYKVMTILLQLKCRNTQIVPVVISGTHYLYLYTKAVSNNFELSNKFKKVRLEFLKNLEQKRPIDWIYYEIISNIFGIQISPQDQAQISKSKEILKKSL